MRPPRPRRAGHGGRRPARAARRREVDGRPPLAALGGLLLVELDRLFWSEPLAPTPWRRWRAVQEELVSAPCRILEGDLAPYDDVDVRLLAADTVVILDFPLLSCAWRAAHRSRQRWEFWRLLATWRLVHRPGCSRGGQVGPAGPSRGLRSPGALERFLARALAARRPRRRLAA